MFIFRIQNGFAKKKIGPKNKTGCQFLLKRSTQLSRYSLCKLLTSCNKGTLVIHTFTILRSLSIDGSHCFCDVLNFCLFKMSHTQRTQLICLILLASKDGSDIREYTRSSDQLFWGSVVPYKVSRRALCLKNIL